MNKVCVILNGPPACGKDTLGELLQAKGFKVLSNKAPMLKAALAISGIDRKVWNRRYENRERKEIPWDALGGLSCRDYLIWISEQVVKPLHGKDHFGRLSAASVQATDCDVAFTDGGFEEELIPLSEAVGKENLLLVHLFREGFSFDGDSRNYMRPNGCEYLPIKLVHGFPEDAVSQILYKIQKMRGEVE